MNAFPFDSNIVGYEDDGMPIYDRASNAEEFARLIASFFGNGVFGADMCEVLENTGMTAQVGVGNLLIEGRYGYIVEPETVNFAAASASPRIDTVVLRRDLSSAVNNIVTAVVQGTPSTNPVAPLLTRDGTVWELGIADVLIPANSTAISQANITDTRLDPGRCGIVAAVMTDIDTTELYRQIQADLAFFKQTEQANFELWFASIQGLLEGDVAANLAAEVNKKAQVNGLSLMLPIDGWAGDSPYTQDLAVSGVTSDRYSCHVQMSDDPEYEEAFAACVPKVVAQHDGSITMRVESIPEEAFPVNILVTHQGVGA